MRNWLGSKITKDLPLQMFVFAVLILHTSFLFGEYSETGSSHNRVNDQLLR